uniref:Choline transporter-like protein n=1 Tax=Timema douglasi TaxID=61478 RepID=A0A7R8VAV4_TIMDO|nr:unnamed protein product [Timema douglasi]
MIRISNSIASDPGDEETNRTCDNAVQRSWESYTEYAISAIRTIPCRNKSSLDSPILKSFKNLVRYHLGTVAMGSLLIALVQMVRVVLTFVQNRLKGYDNSVTRCLFKCCQCCLYLLEKFLKFFTRNAYIQTAIHGSSFCRSGKQAFSLLSANALRVAAINSVGDFVLFLGKAMVVISTVLIGIKMNLSKTVKKPLELSTHLQPVIAKLGAQCLNE